MHFKFNSYLILEIEPQATLEEIKRAYRLKSKCLHPDAGGSTEAQIALNQACEVLLDPLLKSRHDRFWRLVPRKSRRSGSRQRTAAAASGAEARGGQQQAPESGPGVKTQFSRLVGRVREEALAQLKQQYTVHGQ